MAKFTHDEAVAVITIQQLINEWAYELDVNHGLQIADLVTGDCLYHVGGEPRQGREAVEKFYQGRLERMAATPEGVPTLRHTLSNLRTTFSSASEASIAFSLTYYSTLGMAKGLDHADPAAVADVRMTCRKEDDGHWRIASFDSNQTFKRVLG